MTGLLYRARNYKDTDWNFQQSTSVLKYSYQQFKVTDIFLQDVPKNKYFGGDFFYYTQQSTNSISLVGLRNIRKARKQKNQSLVKSCTELEIRQCRGQDRLFVCHSLLHTLLCEMFCREYHKLTHIFVDKGLFLLVGLHCNFLYFLHFFL